MAARDSEVLEQLGEDVGLAIDCMAGNPDIKLRYFLKGLLSHLRPQDKQGFFNAAHFYRTNPEGRTGTRGQTGQDGWAPTPEPGVRPSEAWRGVLGLPPSGPVSSDDLTRAYRAKVLTAHPDQGGSAEAFARVQAAYISAKRAFGYA